MSLRVGNVAGRSTRSLVVMWKVLAVAVACASLHVSAKCARETYQVAGVVRDRGGKPISGATIGVAWGGSTKWNSGTESAQSSRDGSFSVSVPFDTLSGEGAMGDICEGHLASAIVDVAASGYRPVRNVVQFNERQAQANLRLERVRE